ncbi:hypothetical protein [Thalassobius sp. MITS945101]|uniref:hypothetical protein n=1 Tax=Thalassobius sp. MITS945101 TaxID=3096994 RepID=UPI003999678F
MTKQDHEDLSKLIRAELESSEVMKHLQAYEERTRPPTLGEVARHPFVLTVLGFCLTAIFGSLLEREYSAKQVAQAEREAAIVLAHEQEAEAQRAFAAIEALTSERITRGAMLKSAIKRGSAEEVGPRKRVYDEAYVDWNTEIQARFVELRRHVTDTNGDVSVLGTKLEAAISKTLTPLLSQIDACLTQAYDQTRKGGEGDAGFVCSKQPNHECRGLQVAEIALTEACADDYWWRYVDVREKQLRDCFLGLSADAFLYFRSQMQHRAALAKWQTGAYPEQSLERFEQACGETLGREIVL